MYLYCIIIVCLIKYVDLEYLTIEKYLFILID